MKILIAPDKFKGSLAAQEVCQAIAAGLKRQNPVLDIRFHPMADGGDGSLAILSKHLGLTKSSIQTEDPLGRPIQTQYFNSKKAAFIEVASASGLVLLTNAERNPLLTSTLGTGRLIADALTKGYENIYLFLGGSATNDAGIGIAQALGFRFLDKHHRVLNPIGKNLIHIKYIENTNLLNLQKSNLTLFCDVINPLFGPSGAAYVYAAQKGANMAQIQELDEGLRNLSAVMHQQYGIDVSQIVGCGAAGGIAASLIPLCQAKLVKGFDAISELTDLEQHIQWADIVISGEGKLDAQSFQGKVIKGIANLCQKHQKPLHLFVGINQLNEQKIQSLSVKSVFSIVDIAKDKTDAMLNGQIYLEQLAHRLLFS